MAATTAIKQIRFDELQLLQELVRERDPWRYDAKVWFVNSTERDKELGEAAQSRRASSLTGEYKRKSCFTHVSGTQAAHHVQRRNKWGEASEPSPRPKTLEVPRG